MPVAKLGAGAANWVVEWLDDKGSEHMEEFQGFIAARDVMANHLWWEYEATGREMFVQAWEFLINNTSLQPVELCGYRLSRVPQVEEEIPMTPATAGWDWVGEL